MNFTLPHEICALTSYIGPCVVTWLLKVFGDDMDVMNENGA